MKRVYSLQLAFPEFFRPYFDAGRRHNIPFHPIGIFCSSNTDRKVLTTQGQMTGLASSLHSDLMSTPNKEDLADLTNFSLSEQSSILQKHLLDMLSIRFGRKKS
jgi:hypothetical protein